MRQYKISLRTESFKAAKQHSYKGTDLLSFVKWKTDKTKFSFGSILYEM